MKMKTNFIGIKRILGVILTGTMLLAMGLTGCGNQSSDDAAYTIDWYIVANTAPTAVEAVEAKADEYLKDKINAKLKLHYLTWAQYYEKLNVMNAGGEKYDICWINGDSYKLNATKNAYLPIDDLLDKYAPKTKEIIGDEFLKGSQINGKNYGIPANKDKGHSAGIMYRKDLADKYGFTEKLNNIKSIDEIYPMLDVIKQNEPGIEPLLEHGPGSSKDLLFFDTFAFPAGVYVNGEDKVVNYVESPEYKEACEKTRYNFVNGYSWLENKESSENFFIQISGLKAGKAKELNGTRKYEWCQVELTDGYMTDMDTTGSIMAISRTSENPEKVMQFLELFNTDEYLNNLIVFGIEGVNYTKNDDNTIAPIENSGYGNSGMQWVFGNTFINYTVQGEDLNKVQEMEKFNEMLIPAPNLGFTCNQESIKTEVGACQNVKKEFENRLANGAEDVDTILNEYISKLKAAGSDKILEEVTKQYNEWKANNK